MNNPCYRLQIVQTRVIEHNLYPTLHGFSISARYRGAGQLCCLWQLSGKRNASREPTADRSIVIGHTAATLTCIKFASLLRSLVPLCFVARLSMQTKFRSRQTNSLHNYICEQLCLNTRCVRALQLSHKAFS
jgi:hypothetical protein